MMCSTLLHTLELFLLVTRDVSSDVTSDATNSSSYTGSSMLLYATGVVVCTWDYV